MKTGDSDQVGDMAQREAKLREQLSARPTIFDALGTAGAKRSGSTDEAAKLSSAVRVMSFLSYLCMISILGFAILHLLEIIPNDPAASHAMPVYLQLLAGLALINLVAVAVIRGLFSRITALEFRVAELARLFHEKSTL